MENIIISDGSNDILSKEYVNVLWRDFATCQSTNVVSIPKLIEDNALHLRSQYLAWVNSIGQLSVKGRSIISHLRFREEFSYWWTSLLIEKSNYGKSPHITDAIRMLAFVNWARGRHINSIRLTSSSKSLAVCFRIWCRNCGIKFEWHHLIATKTSASFTRHIYLLLPHTVRAIIWLCKYIKNRYSLISTGVNFWGQSEGRVFFISYLFNLPQGTYGYTRFRSQYWGSLPEELLRFGYKLNWLHFFIPDHSLPDSKYAAKLIDAFNRNGDGKEVHATLDSFLNIRVVFGALRDFFILAFKGTWLRLFMVSPVREGLDLWPLFIKDWKESTSGVGALRATLDRSLFEEALKMLKDKQIGFYPQENQGWEFALIQTWKSKNVGRLIGVPHTVVRFWDLRYFFHPSSYGVGDDYQIPIPDQVAVNGKAAADAYINGGYPKEKIIQVEALRFMYLQDVQRQIKAKQPRRYKHLRLLVIGDYVSANTILQLQLLSKAMKIMTTSISITVKPHPACPVRLEDYPELKMKLETNSLSELLLNSDVVYSSSFTTASLDAYIAGVKVVSVIDDSTLNMSPLRGLKGVQFVRTPNDLANALCSIDHSTAPRITADDFFNLDESLSRYKKIFNIN